MGGCVALFFFFFLLFVLFVFLSFVLLLSWSARLCFCGRRGCYSWHPFSSSFLFLLASLFFFFPFCLTLVCFHHQVKRELAEKKQSLEEKDAAFLALQSEVRQRMNFFAHSPFIPHFVFFFVVAVLVPAASLFLFRMFSSTLALLCLFLIFLTSDSLPLPQVEGTKRQLEETQAQLSQAMAKLSVAESMQREADQERDVAVRQLRFELESARRG
jgi:hypothetical protein